MFSSPPPVQSQLPATAQPTFMPSSVERATARQMLRSSFVKSSAPEPAPAPLPAVNLPSSSVVNSSLKVGPSWQGSSHVNSAPAHSSTPSGPSSSSISSSSGAHFGTPLQPDLLGMIRSLAPVPDTRDRDRDRDSSRPEESARRDKRKSRWDA